MSKLQNEKRAEPSPLPKVPLGTVEEWKTHRVPTMQDMRGTVGGEGMRDYLRRWF